MSPTSLQTPLITLVVAALVVVRFLARELRERRIVLSRMFAIPAVLLALAAFSAGGTLFVAPRELIAMIVGAVAASIVGTCFGLAVAQFTSVRLAPEPGAFFSRGSLTTVGIWIAALLLRWLARFVAGPSDRGTTFMLNTVLVFMLAVAVFVVRWRLLARVRSARAVALV